MTEYQKGQDAFNDDHFNGDIPEEYLYASDEIIINHLKVMIDPSDEYIRGYIDALKNEIKNW